jgi:hypothetical protein
MASNGIAYGWTNLSTVPQLKLIGWPTDSPSLLLTGQQAIERRPSGWHVRHTVLAKLDKLAMKPL